MIYHFKDIASELGLSKYRFRNFIELHGLSYSKLGHSRWFTEVQYEAFQKAMTCSPSTKEKTYTTSEAPSPLVTEWLKSGALQDSLQGSKQKSSADM